MTTNKLTETEKKKLKAEAYAEYEKITNPAYSKYTKKRDSALADALAEYLKVENPAYAEYLKRCKEIEKM